MWNNFFSDGGWGMYPTTLFGLIFVACGFLFLFRPERRFAPVVLCAGIMTLGSGVLGTVVGLVTTFRFLSQVAPAEQFQIAALGTAESLNNLVLALILTVLTALITWLGCVRAVLKPTGD